MKQTKDLIAFACLFGSLGIMGCGKSIKAQFAEQIKASWEVCQKNPSGPGSGKVLLDFNSKKGEYSKFASDDCTGAALLTESGTFKYEIVEDSVSVDGAVEMNLEQERLGKSYTIAKIDGNKLFLGEADDKRNGLSATKRFQKLSTTPLIKK